MKRHFCGFCGTQLTVWSEESKEEAEWVCVNLGSLKSESLERLEDAGFLSGRGNQESDVKMEQKDENILTKTEAYQGRELLGTPWFEEMIEGSELGRVRRRRGGQSSSDGRSRVEWEIVEYGNDDEESRIQGSSKRKLDMLARGDDVEMRGG